jgi:hypothetical protein
VSPLYKNIIREGNVDVLTSPVTNTDGTITAHKEKLRKIKREMER